MTRRGRRVYEEFAGVSRDCPPETSFEALRFPLFAQYLAVDHNGTPQRSRDAFNLALFSQLVDKFEFTYNVSVLSPKWLDSNLSHLFLQFFHFMLKGGLEEFEDYEERAPSGCVSVMTIHQSKGLEFPVTCVGSLTRNPKKAYTDLDAILEEKYFHREPFEPLERIKNFDFWREYYVAFSRPQNLLVLTGALDKKDRLGKTFDDIAADVPGWTDKCFTSRALHLETVKKTNYQRQLQVYAHIVEKKFGKKVSKLHLYYTRAEGESPYVSWPASATSVEKTIRSFDEVVAKIESYQFSNKSVKKCAQLCDNCDMRFYCRYK